MLCGAAGCLWDTLGFSRQRVPSVGSATLGGMQVLEPGLGGQSTFPARERFGELQISAPASPA